MAVPTTSQPLSRRAYARQRGVSEAAIRKYVKRGVLNAALTPERLIIPEVADRLLAEAITRPGAQPEPQPLVDANLRRQRARVRRLLDEVQHQRARLITPDDVASLLREQHVLIATRLRLLPDAARAVAGMDAQAAHRSLRDLVIEVLTDMSAAAPEDDEQQSDDEDDVDIELLSPVALAALQANLQAELLELQRHLERGEMLVVMDAVEAFESQLGVLKSIITSMPGLVAPLAQDSTPDAVETLVSAEVERALATLAGN